MVNDVRGSGAVQTLHIDTSLHQSNHMEIEKSSQHRDRGESQESPDNELSSTIQSQNVVTAFDLFTGTDNQ